MKSYQIFVSLFFVVLFSNSFGQEKITSAFDTQWLKAIVSIEAGDVSNAKSIGTGFIMESDSALVLITAKHVVLNEDGSIRQNIVCRVNDTDGKSKLIPAIFPRKYFKNGGWFFSDKNDIACRFFARYEHSDIRSIPVNLSLGVEYLQPSTDILIIGFPLGLRNLEYSNPIVRKGIIARNDITNIIVDSFVFPGNSGGPVIYSPPIKIGEGLKSTLINSEKLIGVVTSYIPYNDIAVSSQTKRPRISFEENSGLCNVVPIGEVIKILESEEFKQISKKKNILW